MRTLVTGAAGLLGRAVARQMAATGYPGDIVLTDRVMPAAPSAAFTCVQADLGDGSSLPALLDGVDRVLSLAAVPGGAAQADPALSARINRDAPIAMLDWLAAHRPAARFVHASSIAVFGAPFPEAIDDDTWPLPTMVYGRDKLAVERAIEDRAIDGWALRLPGLVARGDADTGLKSAFMSALFVAMRDRRALTLPVSPDATVWLMSTECAGAAILHGLTMGPAWSRHALTLPALHVRVADLLSSIARATGAAPSLIRHAPDPAIEAQFGRLPPLSTPAADYLGFRHDGSLDLLVARALAGLNSLETLS